MQLRSATAKRCWINGLPTELQLIILNEVDTLGGPSIYYSALAQSRWKDEALRLLYHSVILKSSEAVEGIAASGGLGKYPTRLLSIGVRIAWSDDIMKMLELCSETIGILYLGLKDVIGELFSLVCFPALRKLVLASTFSDVDSTASFRQTPHPLSLTSLFTCSLTSSTVLESIVNSILESYLRHLPPTFHLILVGMPPIMYTAESVAALSSLARIVTGLSLLEVSASPEVTDFVSTFNPRQLHLQDTTNEDLKAFLAALRAPHLEWLECSLLDTDVSSETVKILYNATMNGSLKDLKFLSVQKVSREQWQAIDGVKELAEILTEKGGQLFVEAPSA